MESSEVEWSRAGVLELFLIPGLIPSTFFFLVILTICGCVPRFLGISSRRTENSDLMVSSTWAAVLCFGSVNGCNSMWLSLWRLCLRSVNDGMWLSLRFLCLSSVNGCNGLGLSLWLLCVSIWCLLVSLSSRLWSRWRILKFGNQYTWWIDDSVSMIKSYSQDLTNSSLWKLIQI